MTDLDDALADLRRALDTFATAYVTSVARQLERELKAATPFLDLAPRQDLSVVRLDKRSLPCPRNTAHPRHVWRFPDTDQSEQCPGVTFQVARCLKTDAHAPHDWEMAAEASTGTLGRRCPGLTSVQCRDNLAHHVHTWHGPGPATTLVSCPGLEADREVQWCASRPYDHGAHEWGIDGVAPRFFCRGIRPEGAFREPCLILTPHEAHDWRADPRTAAGNLARRCGGVEIEVKRCKASILNPHPSHNWEDPDDAHTLKACPGQGPMVPAGPDRHA